MRTTISDAPRTLFACCQVVIGIGLIVGCENKVELVPVEGKVLYEGKPLEFGGVLFQPDAGPMARGTIQPDGTFELETPGIGPGAVAGRHRVQVSCTSLQRPNTQNVVGEDISVESYIPDKYTNYATSGLEAEVKPGCEPFVYQIK